MCVVHPSSVLPKFSNSRNSFCLFWCLFLSGLDSGSVSRCFLWVWELLELLSSRRGRARSMPTLICVPKVSKTQVFSILWQIEPDQHLWLPTCGSTTKKSNKQSVPVYCLRGAQSTAPDRRKKKNHLVKQSQLQRDLSTWLGKVPQDWEGVSMFYPWLQFKIVYLWLECKLSNPHGLAACPAASVHVLEQGGRKCARSCCAERSRPGDVCELHGRGSAPGAGELPARRCAPAPLCCTAFRGAGPGSGEQRCAKPHLFHGKTRRLIAFPARLYSGQLHAL